MFILQKFNLMECGKSDFQFKVIEKIKNLRHHNNVSQRQLTLLLDLSPGKVIIEISTIYSRYST